ncbi:beta-glucocerebrosidase 2-like protein [Kribbella amoyensis]|uniref:Beta-glucocerebrosidase 2-like protein n=1 Tax=Kribbella amoyensis TaxID=996641 RepID=A0A561C0P9_9ACTN|nr:GH116 family glycosyl hydrolase [Kribbella amoyensis]TWD84725.1 beta-glucocerebrosidase 2-like protein [Kribbella amoyensis]
MDSTQPPPGCANRTCAGDCQRAHLSRRTFLSLSAASVGALAVPSAALAAVPVKEDTDPAVLFGRGRPTEYTGTALPKIGMPVGGGTTGQVYLAGDGRLWAWDIFNPSSFPLGGADFSGSNYAKPLSADQPGADRFGQGFALRTTARGRTTTRTVDAAGFDDVRFTGQYPVGRVTYADVDSPVEVELEAFSPFVPLATLDSTLPATILAFTVRNTSGTKVKATLLGYAENPVCLDSRQRQPTKLRVSGFGRGVEFGAVDDLDAERDDIVFEDWEKDTYDGWTVTGEAFGDGPVRPLSVPNLLKRFGDLNVSGTRFVTSYAFRSNGPGDAATGKLTSREFTVQRRYVAVGVSGGNHPGETCVNVLVDGQVVASATGAESEPLVGRLLDLGEYRGRSARIEIVDAHTGGWGHISCDTIVFTDRADILFENWDRETYEGWTVSGDAFGPGPVTAAETPEGFRRPFGVRTELNVTGRFATSYAFRKAGDPDASTGKLTSREFTVERRFVTAWIGGGHHQGETCLNVLVDGEVVATAAGTDIEPLTAVSMDVGQYAGRAARIEIVDASTGGWGHVNVDRILFSDRPIRRQPVAERPDGGTFALAALSSSAVVRPSIADWSTTDALFDSAEGPVEVDGIGSGQAGTVAIPVSLAPGESTTVRFIYGWFFPNPEREVFAELVGAATFKRHYATRFDSARQVVGHVAADADRLERETRTWVKTWYADSTLPHWFLERTLATASTIATGTCYRWDDGRFYAWEGTYCCAGTCQHVWNYAQAIGRLFPDLERDTRERVDLGIAYRPSGEIGNRGEAGDASSSFADGQSGTVLRFYREHQMSKDAEFLRRNWPKIRTAVEFLVTSRDGADEDGVLRGSQWNTLDTEWYGEIPWLSGLYVAALRAAAAMATEVGDPASATRYSAIAERGSTYLAEQLWNEEYGYYVHRLDPAHPSENTNDGCHIDQLYGQTYAAQLGLPRVFPAGQAKRALRSVYEHNFRPDPFSYRPPGINPGRIYATSGEAGTVMTTWPHGGSTRTQGLMYFNEVWTGQEYQFAAHLFAEGMTTEAMTVTRALYDRYSGEKRNPYNEIEASDHYARAMMGFGTYLAACGYEYHGPRGHLGFAPRIRPEDFRCAFTAAEGWGSYGQRRTPHGQSGRVEVRYGRVRLVTLAFETAKPARRVEVRLGPDRLPAQVVATGNRAVVTLARPAVVTTAHPLTIELSS